MKGDNIPNGEFLYKYVKPEIFPEGQDQMPHGIFEDQNESLSCDWASIQKAPEKSFHIAEGKNVIVRITVCDEIRYPCNPERPRHKQPAWEQKIEHDPIQLGEDPSHPQLANLSHSVIIGKKKAHITKAIARNAIFYKKVDPNRESVSLNLEIVPNEYVKSASLFAVGLILAFFVILLLILILLWF